MKRMNGMLMKKVLIVAILTVILFTWGNQMVSPNANFGGDLFEKPMTAWASEHDDTFTTARTSVKNTHQLQWIENEDKTFTVTLFVSGELGGFDYGIAFSPEEVTVTDYGFTSEFKSHYSKQQGSVVDHYFSEGKRVSGQAQYIVYGGMATQKATYDGAVCFLTVSLKGEQATFFAVDNSAQYEHARELMAAEISCTLLKENDQSKDKDSNGYDSVGDDSNGDNPSGDNPSGDNLGRDDSSEDHSREDNLSEGSTSSDDTNGDNSAENNSGNDKPWENDTKSAAASKDLQIVKTGDESKSTYYFLTILVATLVLRVTVRNRLYKN